MGCSTRRCAITSPSAAPEVLGEAGRAVGDAFVPQAHLPGAEAEADFADLWVILRGIKTKVFLFTMRRCSGKAVHRTGLGTMVTSIVA